MSVGVMKDYKLKLLLFLSLEDVWLTTTAHIAERLKTKNEESTLLGGTGLVVELERLKTKTRLIDKKFASVRGECEI